MGSLRCCRLLLRALKLVLPLRDPLRLPITLFAPPSPSMEAEAEAEAGGEGGEGGEGVVGTGGGEGGGAGGGEGEVLAFLLMLLADQVAGEISGEHYTLFSSGSFWRNAQASEGVVSSQHDAVASQLSSAAGSY